MFNINKFKHHVDTFADDIGLFYNELTKTLNVEFVRIETSSITQLSDRCLLFVCHVIDYLDLTKFSHYCIIYDTVKKQIVTIKILTNEDKQIVTHLMTDACVRENQDGTFTLFHCGFFITDKKERKGYISQVKFELTDSINFKNELTQVWNFSKQTIISRIKEFSYQYLQGENRRIINLECVTSDYSYECAKRTDYERSNLTLEADSFSILSRSIKTEE